MIKTILKIVISAGLLVVILFNINITEVLVLLRKTHVLYLCAAFIVLNVANIITFYRLMFFFPDNKSINFTTMLRIHYASYSLSLFLPGRIGGDINRIYRLISLTGEKSRTVVTVLLWRYIGMLSLIITASVMLVFNASITRYVRIPSVLVLVVTGGAVIMAGLLYLPVANVLSIVTKLGYVLSRFKEKMDYLTVSLGKILSMKRAISLNIVSALIGNSLIFCAMWILSYAVGNPIPLGLFFLFSPVASLIQHIPISLGGIGLRESSYIVLFMKAGIGPEIILSVMLLYYILSIAVGLAGYILFLTVNDSGNQIRTQKS